jgi:ADP-heptose:LPS heptosyltransferase
VRLDDAGEVLLAGPAVRAVARKSHVTFLTAAGGAEAAALLPGVTDVLTWQAPWAGKVPPAFRASDVALLVKRMAAGRFDDALIFTSRGASPLPTAMVLRLAGISQIAGMGSDAPGSLLDVWHDPAPAVAEPDRSLALARAAGYDLAPGDDGHLAVRRPLPATKWLTGAGPYLVAHAADSAAADATQRAGRWAAAIADLVGSGHRLVLTGKTRGRAAAVQPALGAPGNIVDLAGRTDLLQLAGVVDMAEAVLAGTPRSRTWPPPYARPSRSILASRYPDASPRRIQADVCRRGGGFFVAGTDPASGSAYRVLMRPELAGHRV